MYFRDDSSFNFMVSNSILQMFINHLRRRSFLWFSRRFLCILFLILQVFFFVFFFQFMISVIYALGIGGMGSSGFILGIGSITSQESSGGLVFVGVLMLISGFGFALCALGDFYLLVTIHKLYRSSGASMAKAQAEFTSGVLQNEQVQAAAAAAARETVRTQFNQAGGGGGGNDTAPRY